MVNFLYLINFKGYIGRTMVEQLRNDNVNDINHHIIIGT